MVPRRSWTGTWSRPEPDRRVRRSVSGMPLESVRVRGRRRRRGSPVPCGRAAPRAGGDRTDRAPRFVRGAPGPAWPSGPSCRRRPGRAGRPRRGALHDVPDVPSRCHGPKGLGHPRLPEGSAVALDDLLRHGGWVVPGPPQRWSHEPGGGAQERWGDASGAGDAHRGSHQAGRAATDHRPEQHQGAHALRRVQGGAEGDLRACGVPHEDPVIALAVLRAPARWPGPGRREAPTAGPAR